MWRLSSRRARNEIFSRLPVETLLRFKCASKSCYDLITSPDFVKLQLSCSLHRNSDVVLLYLANSVLASFDFHQPQLPVVQLQLPDAIKTPPHLVDIDSDDDDFVTPTKIVGISNGVVCFNISDDRRVDCFLYNPATRASKQIPRPLTKVQDCFSSYFYDFGYDCIGSDYKILCVVNFRETDTSYSACVPETYIYSLKSNSWQNLENQPWCDLVRNSCSVVANNSFCWISNDDKVITRFDLCSLTYDKTTLLPLECVSNSKTFPGDLITLVVLKGHLHVIKSCKGSSTCIWMLKEDHQWTLLYRYLDSNLWKISQPLPCAYSKDGNKILAGFKEKRKTFVCYDLNSQSSSTVDVLGLPELVARPWYTVYAVPWVESLMQLG